MVAPSGAIMEAVIGVQVVVVSVPPGLAQV
jgi:hypothetical protein